MTVRIETERVEQMLCDLIKSHQALLDALKRHAPNARINFKLAGQALAAASVTLDDLRMGKYQVTRNVLDEEDDDEFTGLV